METPCTTDGGTIPTYPIQYTYQADMTRAESKSHFREVGRPYRIRYISKKIRVSYNYGYKGWFETTLFTNPRCFQLPEDRNNSNLTNVPNWPHGLDQILFYCLYWDHAPGNTIIVEWGGVIWIIKSYLFKQCDVSMTYTIGMVVEWKGMRWGVGLLVELGISQLIIMEYMVVRKSFGVT